MAKLSIKPGSTSQTVYVFVEDSSSTVGAGLTGLAYNTASLTAYYVRPLGSATAITLATQTVTGAYSSGGFVEVSSSNVPGLYRLDLPDAVLATGVRSVVVMLKGATNMAPVRLEIDLNAEVNVTHFAGSTASTYDGTAQAGASSTITLQSGSSSTDNLYRGRKVTLVGGTGAGQSRWVTAYVGSTLVATVYPAWTTTPDSTSQYIFEDTADANVTHVGGTAQTARDLGASVLLSSGTGPGQVKLSNGYVAPNWADVANATSTVALTNTTFSTTQAVASVTGAVGSVTGNVGGNVVGSVASVTGNVGGNVSGNVTGSVGSVTGNVAGNVAGSVASVVGSVGGSVLGSVASVAAGGISSTSFAAATGLRTVQSGTAQGGTSTTITLDSGASSTTDLYVNLECVLTGGTGAGQTRAATAYNGTTKVLTVNSAWTVTPDNTTTFALRPQGLTPAVTGLTAADVWAYGTRTLTSGSGLTVAAVSGTVNANVVQVSGDSIAADNWEAMLDGTGGVTLSLGRLDLNHPTLAPVSIVAGGSAAVAVTNTDATFPAVYVSASAAGAVSLVGNHATTPTLTLVNSGAGGVLDDDTLAAFAAAVAVGLDDVLVESGISASSNLTNDTGTQLTSINLRQAVAAILSATAAKLAGGGTTSITTKPGGKPSGNNRITATVDDNRNRTAVVLKVPD